MGYATVALILFFGITLALNVGFYANPAFEAAYIVTNAYRGNLTETDTSKQFFSNLISEWLIPTVIGAAAILLALTAGAAIEIVVAAGAVAFLANKLLLPIAIINAVGLPYPLDFMLLGFMNLLLLVGIFGFIRGFEP